MSEQPAPDPADVLKEHLDRAVAMLTLGISDALGPVRPVSGVQPGERRSAKVLLRAIERAYVELAGPSAQRAYDLMAENSPTPAAPEPEPEPELLSVEDYLVDERDPSTSVRAILSGLPTLGKGRR